ncbi:MAG: DUF4124 domain-containing protein [Desulfuromonadales bacterium]
MYKLLLLSCFSLLLTSGLVMAKIYSCTDAQGTVIYTDDPSKMPRGCKPDQTVELPQLNVIPVPTTPPARLETPGSAGGRTGSQGQQANQDDSYALLNSQAQDLIARYNAARRKATFAPLFRDKEAGRSELNEIQSEKHNLMNEIEKSSMEQTRKNEIFNKLSQVPD